MGLLIHPGFQFSDDNGDPAAAGRVFFYATGTTNLQDVYSDPDFIVGTTTPIANPQTLSSAGIFPTLIYAPENLRYTISAQDSGGTDLPGFPQNDIWAIPENSNDLSYSQGGVGSVNRSLSDRLQDNTFSKDFGTVIDGVTNDTAALTAAIADRANKILNLGPGTFSLTSITLSSPIEIRGAGKGKTILKASTAVGALNFLEITASDVTIRDLTIDLDNTANTIAAGYVANRVGIYAHGASNASYNSGLSIIDVETKNCGESGISLQYMDNVDIVRPEINRCGKHGIKGFSVSKVRIHKPNIFDIFPGEAGVAPYLNAYGVTFSRDGADNVPVDCDVVDGWVENVTSWEAYDTHAGKRIRFINCSSKNCNQGTIVQSTSAGSESEDITIIGGTHEGYGIDFTRDTETNFDTGSAVVANMGSTVTPGKGLVIKGVISRNMGSGKDSSNAAITATEVDSYSIEGNIVSDSYKRGITTGQVCINGSISGNVVDNVTSVGSLSRGIETSSETLAVVSGNSVTGTTNQSYFHSTPASAVYGITRGQNLDADTDNIQLLSAPGAIAINDGRHTVHVTVSAAQAITLADGEEGESKRIICIAQSVGIGTVTPDNFGNGTSFALAAAGETADLLFTNSAWYMIGGTAVIS